MKKPSGDKVEFKDYESTVSLGGCHNTGQDTETGKHLHRMSSRIETFPFCFFS